MPLRREGPASDQTQPCTAFDQHFPQMLLMELGGGTGRDQAHSSQISAPVLEDLSAAYETLRNLEHRAQMIADDPD